MTTAYIIAKESLEYHQNCLEEAKRCGRMYDTYVHTMAVEKLTKHIKRYWPNHFNKLGR